MCYGGPRDEEVNEVIHENIDEKECNPLMLKMGVFEVVDEKEEMEHEIKGARGTEERVSTTSENNVYNTYVKPMSHSSINAEMLTIAARTHAV